MVRFQATARVPVQRAWSHTTSVILGLCLATVVSAASRRAWAETDAAPTSADAKWSAFGGLTLHNASNLGLHIGGEYPLAHTPRFRSVMSTAFQTYHEPRTQTGYALLIRWGQRYTSGFGLTLESHFGIGAQLTCYDITAFEFQGSVGTRREASELRVGFVPHLVLGPGYDFEPLLDVPLHIYTRPGVMVIYPDSNLAFQTGLIAELGVRWTPRL